MKVFETMATIPNVEDARILTDYNNRIKEQKMYRSVDVTIPGKLQIVSMYLRAGQSVGREFHPKGVQTFFIISGSGTVEIGRDKKLIGPGALILVPENVYHNIGASKSEDLAFITTYTSVLHIQGEVMPTQNDANFCDRIRDFGDKIYKREVPDRARYETDYEAGFFEYWHLDDITELSEKEFENLAKRNVPSLNHYLKRNYGLKISSVDLIKRRVELVSQKKPHFYNEKTVRYWRYGDKEVVTDNSDQN